MNSYWQAWQRYFDFRGNSSRTDFWWFMFWHLFITLILIVIEISLQLEWPDAVYGLLSFVPMIAYIVRRLHDSGRSGWWGYVFFIPAIGPIWLIILLAMKSTTSFSSKEYV